MAKTNREKREAAEAQRLARLSEAPPLEYPVVALPGVPSALIWDELAEEAAIYTKLLARLKATPLDAAEREDLEDQIISSLNHLVVHGTVLHDAVDEAIENSEEVETV